MASSDNQGLTVYLDHLIERESFRYQRSDQPFSLPVAAVSPANTSPTPRIPQERLDLRELSMESDFSKLTVLRKPDFQRETCSWDAEDCVYLLESLVGGQVIPSIVAWKSKDRDIYILDGAHRISAIIAWLNDDWGDKVEWPDYDDIEDRERGDQIKRAAKQVRQSVKDRIGTLNDFRQAHQKMGKLKALKVDPEVEMEPKEYERALFFQDYRQGDIGLHVLWVQGNYEMAEQSFLRINKGGKKLSYWETRIVADRNSSFVRAIMSIANVSSVTHYWPEMPKGTGKTQDKTVDKITKIHSSIANLHQVLFSPQPPKKFVPVTHPFFVVPSIADKPSYLAELLCVILGGRGLESEIDELITRDKESRTDEIVANGVSLVTKAEDAFAHLTGDSPKSLGIVPLLYFYTDKGKHIRSLLYGFISWLTHGSPEEILQRKRAFTVHREAFEHVLLMRKDDIVRGVSRKTGSGTEVTGQIALYYHRLLDALIRHNDQYESEAFSDEYKTFTKPLVSKDTTAYKELDSRARIFSPSQKASALYAAFFASPQQCGICHGVMDLAKPVQHDHIIDHSQGGRTTRSNQRPTHPFCNEPGTKSLVEAAMTSSAVVTLPAFSSTIKGSDN